MKEVDLEGAGDVVGAVAVGRIGSRPDSVLHDPDAVGQDLEMGPVDGMERQQLRH